jgi:hypothetical protein
MTSQQPPYGGMVIRLCLVRLELLVRQLGISSVGDAGAVVASGIGPAPRGFFWGGSFRKVRFNRGMVLLKVCWLRLERFFVTVWGKSAQWYHLCSKEPFTNFVVLTTWYNLSNKVQLTKIVMLRNWSG